MPNPDILSEQAADCELGFSGTIAPGFTLQTAAFYSDVRNALIQVPVSFPPPIGQVNQTRNVGSGDYFGLEAALNAQITDQIALGLNYTWLHRDFTDPGDPNARPRGVPDHKLFGLVRWVPAKVDRAVARACRGSRAVNRPVARLRRSGSNGPAGSPRWGERDRAGRTDWRRSAKRSAGRAGAS